MGAGGAQQAPPRAFLDLDGTLTDPKPGITRSIRYALQALGRHAPDEDDLVWCIGPPLSDSFATLLDHDPVLVGRAVALYRERFGTVGMYENAPQPGIYDALDRMRDDGARLSVVTSKPRVYARRIVEHFRMDRWIGAVFGPDLDGPGADKPGLIAEALRATGGPAGPAVMVGDRHHDILGARANGVPSIGVLWGYGDHAELHAAGADLVIDDVAALAGAVATLTARPS